MSPRLTLTTEEARTARSLTALWTTVHGIPMYYRSAAPVATPDAPALVLVHGLAMSGRYLMATAQRLASEFAVYVPDLPGFGGSGKPSHVLDVPGLADALEEWMDVMGIRRATVVGNSLGCQVAADHALRYPDRVVSLVLVAPTMDPGHRSLPDLAARLLIDLPRERLALLPLAIRDGLRSGMRRAHRTLRFALLDRIEEKLPHLHIPTLVVRGNRDPFVSRRWALEVAGLLPLGDLLEFPDAAHAPHFSRPAQFAQVVREFTAPTWAHAYR